MSAQLKPDAKIVHMSADPLVAGFPFRDFEADSLITGTSQAAVADAARELTRADRRANGIGSRGAGRRRRRREELMPSARACSRPRASRRRSIRCGWPCVNEVKTEDAIVVSELGAQSSPSELDRSWHLHRATCCRGSRLGLGRRARRQACGARTRSDRRGRRRHLHVRQSPAVSLSSDAPRTCRRSPSWPTITHGTRCARRPRRLSRRHAAKANVMPLTELDPRRTTRR